MAHESMQAWAEASRASRSVHAAVDGARAALHKETAYEVAAVTTEGFPPASSARQMVATVSGDLAVRSSFSNSNEPDEGAGVDGAGGVDTCALRLSVAPVAQLAPWPPHSASLRLPWLSCETVEAGMRIMHPLVYPPPQATRAMSGDLQLGAHYWDGVTPQRARSRPPSTSRCRIFMPLLSPPSPAEAKARFAAQHKRQLVQTDQHEAGLHPLLPHSHSANLVLYEVEVHRGQLRHGLGAAPGNALAPSWSLKAVESIDEAARRLASGPHSLLPSCEWPTVHGACPRSFRYACQMLTAFVLEVHASTHGHMRPDAGHPAESEREADCGDEVEFVWYAMREDAPQDSEPRAVDTAPYSFSAPAISRGGVGGGGRDGSFGGLPQSSSCGSRFATRHGIIIRADAYEGAQAAERAVWRYRGLLRSHLQLGEVRLVLSETELLTELAATVREVDADVLLTWDSCSSLRFLVERAAVIGLEPPFTCQLGRTPSQRGAIDERCAYFCLMANPHTPLPV